MCKIYIDHIYIEMRQNDPPSSQQNTGYTENSDNSSTTAQHVQPIKLQRLVKYKKYQHHKTSLQEGKHQENSGTLIYIYIYIYR